MLKMTTEKIRTATGATIVIEGYRIPSPRGFKFFSLFVHRGIMRTADGYEQDKDALWNVSDLHTGCSVSKGCNTKKEAIDCAADRSKKVGRQKAKKQFDDMITKFKGDLLTNNQETVMSKTPMSKMTIIQMVKEYNQLTGKPIKDSGHKLPSRPVAERRLAGARITLPPKASVTEKNLATLKRGQAKSASAGMAVQAGNKHYPSFTAAFNSLKLTSNSLAVLRRVRKELKANGMATVEGHKLNMV